MRTGWNPELDALLRRADPTARLIAELAVTSAEDVRRRKEEWATGSVSGTIITLPSGGARLQGILGNYVSQTTRNGWITDLDPSGAMKVARLRWPGLRYAQAEVSRIRAWLHPRLNGGQPQEVAWWECRVFTLLRYDAAFGGQRYLSIAEIGRSRVQAGGNEGEVVFDFDRLVPGYPQPEDLAGLGVYPDPITYVAIVALKADGSPAGNVGWAIDTGTTSVTQGPGVTLNGWTLNEVDDSDPWVERFRGWWRDGTLAEAVPYLVVERSSYSPATITFSGSAQINLGRVPDADEAIELVGQGETPSDSSLTFEVLADNGTTWVPFRDGQLVSELPGVSARQTYVLRVTLSPNSEGDVTPTVRNLGARAVRRWPLPELASVQLTNSWGFDPRTLVGSIPTVRVSVLRDGARDFHDLATEVLSQYGVSDIEIRLWIGGDSLPRDRWMLVDTFELEDYVPGPNVIHLDGVHPSARLRVAQLPVYDEITKRREPLVYANVSLADAYRDLISGQAALPERYLGPGITDDTTLVGKLITDGDAKTELDALAYLAGGVVISSQGQVAFRDIANASGVAAIFPAEEIEVVGATPGLRQAVPEWYVPWDWAESESRFRGEVRAFAAAALDAVRAGRLDAPSRLDDRIARWIGTESHAETVGQRHVEWFGLGLILVRFRPHLPHPHLEPGDVVLVETRDFVGRDPHTGRALKGRLWARAVITEVADPLGRDLVAWVRSYADLGAVPEAVTRAGFAAPEVLALTATADQGSGAAGAVVRCRHARSVRIAARTDREPTREEVRSAPVRALTADGNLSASLGVTVPPDGPVYVAALAYEMADGGGAESTDLAAATAKRIVPTQLLLRVRLLSSEGGSLTYRVAVGDPLFASGTGNVTIAWAETGTGGVSPASPRTIAAANLRDTPAASEAAGGYVDFTVNRPASGAGNGRVVFEATRADRIGVTQSVDVPELPPSVPVQALPPLCNLEVTSLGPANALIEVMGVARTGGTTPTQYARREYALGATPPAWGAWQNLTNGTASYTVARGTGSFVIAEAKVRDAAGRESAVARVEIEPAGIARHGESITNFTGRTLDNISDSGSRVAVTPNQRTGADLAYNTIESTGILAQGVKINDGAGPKVPVTGAQRFFLTLAQLNNPVTFEQPYQDTPFAIVRGPMSYSASLGASVNQFRRELVDGLTRFGWDRVIAKLVAYNTIFSTTQNFPAGSITGEGNYKVLGGLSNRASDGVYKVRFTVFLSAEVFPSGPRPRATIDVTVAVDTYRQDRPQDGWLERATRQFTLSSTGSYVTSNETVDVEFTYSGLSAGDDIRVRIKDVSQISVDGTGGFFHQVTAVHVTYRISTETPVEMADDNHYVEVIILGAS